jgi:hypothetical protein
MPSINSDCHLKGTYMKKLIFISLALLFWSCASAPASLPPEAPEPKFEAKGIRVRYDPSIDALIYEATSWGNSPFRVSIIQYGNENIRNAGRAVMQLNVRFESTVPILMSDMIFFADDKPRLLRSEVIGPSSRKDFGYYYEETWARQYDGRYARDFAKLFMVVGESTSHPGVWLGGGGLYHRDHGFSKRQRENLKILGEAWLRYFNTESITQQSNLWTGDFIRMHSETLQIIWPYGTKHK